MSNVAKTKTPKKYYFVYYEVFHCSAPLHNQPGHNDSHTTKFQGIIDTHPLKFQIDCNKKYGTWHDNGNGRQQRETYTVISWQTLSKSEYLRFKEHIG